MESKINNQENNFCLYCISPLIYYNSFENPFTIEALCGKNHKIKYNINNFINMRQNYFNNMYRFLHIYQINKCSEHNKEYRFCVICKKTFCKKCTSSHRTHKTKNFREFFLSDKQKSLLCDIKKLEYFNNFLKFKIFNNCNNKDFENIIYRKRYYEIELLKTLLEEYQMQDSKDIHYPFHLLLNLKFLFFDKYPNIKNMNLFDFINSTEIDKENIPKRNLMINYITQNFYNIKENNNIEENNDTLITFKDFYWIYAFIPLKTNDILILGEFYCGIYSQKMEFKCHIDFNGMNECTYILYKNNNNIDNTEIIYTFSNSRINELEIIKLNNDNYKFNYNYYLCDIDFIQDAIYLNNGYLVVRDYKLKSFALSKNINQYKILEEYTNWPEHINFCGMINLPNNEFAYLMNFNNNTNNYLYVKMKSYINFYKYEIGNNNFLLIKKINLDWENDIIKLFKNEFIIISSYEMELY